MKKSLLLIMALVCTLSAKSKVNDVIIDNNRESDYSVELDDKTIIAKTVMDITSSSSIEVGSLCKMMEVVQSNDPTLLKCSVVCQIVEKRKSNIYGSEGR